MPRASELAHDHEPGKSSGSISGMHPLTPEAHLAAKLHMLTPKEM